PQDFSILLPLSAHDELRGRAHARGTIRAPLESAVAREPPGQLEARPGIARGVLFLGEAPDHVVARPLEVDRDAIAEPRGLAHLIALGARQDLDVDVAAEPFPAPEDVDGGEHAGHGADGAARAPPRGGP